MSQGRFRSFLTGALVGAGLGILLAPKEGSETRSSLKNSFSLLIDTIKNIDVDETKALLLSKVKEIKEELSSIDEATAKDVAKEKVEIVQEKCDELIQEATEIGAPVVVRATESVRDGAVHLLNDFLGELESQEEVFSVKKEEAKPKSSKKQGHNKTGPSKKSNTKKKNTTKSKSKTIVKK